MITLQVHFRSGTDLMDINRWRKAAQLAARGLIGYYLPGLTIDSGPRKNPHTNRVASSMLGENSQFHDNYLKDHEGPHPGNPTNTKRVRAIHTPCSPYPTSVWPTTSTLTNCTRYTPAPPKHAAVAVPIKAGYTLPQLTCNTPYSNPLGCFQHTYSSCSALDKKAAATA